MKPVNEETINAVLLAIVVERVKSEVAKMKSGGMDTNQINEALPDVIAYYTAWQGETLQRCMWLLTHEPPTDADNVTPLRN